MVGTREKKPWVQALVDQCTDVTETQYPGHIYNGFDENQRQKVWQNKNGRPKNAGPLSSTSVTLSELSSTVSTTNDTLAVHNHRLSEGDRDCQPSHND